MTTNTDNTNWTFFEDWQELFDRLYQEHAADIGDYEAYEDFDAQKAWYAGVSPLDAIQQVKAIAAEKRGNRGS